MSPRLNVAADIAGATRSFMRVPQGGTEWHSHKRAHRPGHAHAEVVCVLVLALTSVPRERAALLREEAAPATRRSQRGRLESKHRRRCVLDIDLAHREELERRRHSALEPVPIKVPAAQRRSTPAEASALAVNSWVGTRGGVQVCERGQRGDRRRHAAGEAVPAEVPAPQRARSHAQRARSHARVGEKTARQRTG
jgi:hypothetical protein